LKIAVSGALTFSFNGGPGSASVWLHMGCIGPRRVPMNADGTMPPPPYHLVDNQQTWLDQSDLVFIDPVGTGYSRALQPANCVKVLRSPGRHRISRRIHSHVSGALRTLDIAAVFGGESYGTTPRVGVVGLSDRARHCFQRHRLDLDDHEF
jgi:carboxypeptidase C (cathepsin A)